MKLKSILTVLDKPKHAQVAFDAAAKLQASSGAHLELIAFRHNTLYDDQHSLDAAQRKSLKRELVAKSNAWMDELATGSVDKNNTKRRTIWSKDIAGWLADEVEEHEVDLVIKSVHSRKTLLYTPTDWRILPTCKVPVFAKSARNKKPSGVVLAALDFSRDDATRRRLNNKVMKAATAMAAQTGGVVHTIFAIEISEVLRDLDMVNPQVSKKKILTKIESQVEACLAPFDIPKSRRLFPVGKAGKVINSHAHKLYGDLLVVGTGTRKIRQAIGLGSTVERVLTKAHRDVLTIHS